MNPDIIPYAVAGVFTGAFFASLLSISKVQTLKSSLKSSREEAKRLSEQILRLRHTETLLHESEKSAAAAKAEYEVSRNAAAEAERQRELRHRDEIRTLRDTYSEMLRTIDEKNREANENTRRQYEENMSKVTEQLKAATEDMLRRRQNEFAEASSDSIGRIVTPLKASLEEMNRTLAINSQAAADIGATIRTSICGLMEISERTRQTTEELTRAFRHKSKVQGDWGEAVLTELLETHGFTKGIHFDVQETIRDVHGNTLQSAEGRLMRPDVILHLDSRRDVVIDSKVSLSSYIDYVNEEDDLARASRLKEHLESLWKHVTELSVKDYSAFIRPPKVRMDYVIMFVPHSDALWTAMREKPDLWRKAMEKNVFIADEQTLYAALRIIKMTWTQILQAENHRKVYDIASEIVDRVGQFSKKYDSIGEFLKKTQDAYEDGARKLDERGHSIKNSCAKLLKLGARKSGKNPIPGLIDVDDIEAMAEENTDGMLEGEMMSVPDDNPAQHMSV